MPRDAMHSNGTSGQHLHSCIANAERLFRRKPPSWWGSFPKSVLCTVAWSSRWSSSGLPQFILTASQTVRVDFRRVTVVSEPANFWHYPTLYHGTWCCYLWTYGLLAVSIMSAYPILSLRKFPTFDGHKMHGSSSFWPFQQQYFVKTHVIDPGLLFSSCVTQGKLLELSHPVSSSVRWEQ